MRFEITATHAPEEAPKVVEADSWFEALRAHLQAQDTDIQLHQLACTIRADGASAQARDKESSRVWELQAQLDDPDAMAYFVSQMRQSWFLLKPYGWLLLLVGLLVGAGVKALGGLIQLDATTLWVMAVLAGGQVALWMWSGLACKVGVTEGIAREHWQLDIVRRNGLIAWTLAGAAALAAWQLASRLSIWWLTGLWLFVFIAGLFGLYRLISWLLIQGEFRGALGPGKASKWMGWTTTGMVLLLGAVLLGLVNFIGGMHWWYNTYVTAERRAEVKNRARTLRALQIQSLRDSNKQYLGLYAKSESDWSRYYNDPDLLNWKVSQAVQLSEGAVPVPSWWWGYLPDGHLLQSEPFSLTAFLRVPYYFLKNRRKVGGSTPALQAAKNLMDFGHKRRNKGLLGTIGLKLFVEIPRSYVMSQRFTPREMLATYMATLWAGRGGNYGLHRMSLYYFARPNPATLDWNQAAVLAASLPNPGRFNPWFLGKCRAGKCQGPRTTKIYKVWLERIRQVKAMLRRRGYKVPKQLPLFCNGMSRMRILSRKWQVHDAHIRAWIRKELPHTIPDWQRSSNFQLSYDRALTLGARPPRPADKPLPCHARPSKPGKPTKRTSKPTIKRAAGAPSTRRTTPKKRPKPKQRAQPKQTPKSLVGIVKERLGEYRRYIPSLQVAYTLVNAKSGMIASQYGGDQHVDMALAKKPVVGSTFKVITMFIGGYWPERLPLLNQGSDPKKRHRKRFLYQPHDGAAGHIVRNSHGMAKFVYKRAALSMSANIGFVFLSLRWTWLLDRETSQKILRIGLAQLYEERMKLTPEAAAARVTEVTADRKKLLADLRGPLGYSAYLKRWKTKALFEAGKGMAVQELLAKRRANPRSLTMFLDASSTKGFGGRIQGRWAHHRYKMAGLWKEASDWEWVSWVRPLRMELGLRYIIYLAKRLARFDRRRDHLRPVMTMTLGVNNADTKQLAGVAATVAAGRLVHPKVILTMRRGHKLRYKAALPTEQLPLPTDTLPKIQQAMNSVLRWGTAGRAGRMVAKEHGIAWLKRSGAKTGTVQRSKGVSCIGYLGHYAGALTISTPNNRPLVQYTLRSAYQKQLDGANLQVTRYLTCTKQGIPASPKARICERRWRWWQARALKLQTRNDEYEAKAKKYVRTGRVWKRSIYKSGIYERKANRLANQAGLKRRQGAVYLSYVKGKERMIQLYDRWFLRFNNQAKAQLAKAQKQAKDATKLWQKAKKVLGQSNAALDALKQTLRAKKPHKRKSKKNRREWRKLVRRLGQLRYKVRRATYQAKIYANRTRHAKHRATRAQKRLSKKTRLYRTNQGKQTKHRKRRKHWVRKQAAILKAAALLDQAREVALTTMRQWRAQAAREEAAYNRLEAAVNRTHKRWSLYSSNACADLFALLGHWKRTEEQRAKGAK